MKALILNSVVVDVSEKEFPVHESFAWVEAPNSVSPGYTYENGQFVAPEKTPEELAEEAMQAAKNDRAQAVSEITVEVDGMTFDGDETAQDRMARAITMFTSSGLPADTTTSWVLADNTVAQVTIGQLTQALLLAGQKQTELWTKPYEAVNAEAS